MGRNAPANTFCQICGDKSYGRHYGLWTCDGCACFFKRTIRRKISYNCISGDNKCPVDKTRRNWCPSCRLNKCFEMNMNKNAVQKERGPRPNKLQKISKKQLKKEKQNDDNSQRIDLLTTTVNQTLNNSIIIFLSPQLKRKIIEQLWPILTLVTAASFENPLIFKCTEVNLLLKRWDKQKLDQEEVRLLCSWILCKLGNELEGIDYAPPLSECYAFWLQKHCLACYDPKRAKRVLGFGSELLSFEHYGEYINEFQT